LSHFCISGNASESFVDIRGTKGSIIIRGTLSQICEGSAFFQALEGPAEELAYEKIDMYQSQIIDFVNLIAQKGSGLFERDCFTQNMLDLAYESATSNSLVKWKVL